MKIAILGGGFTGLTAAYDLQKKGHDITIFEKEKILGGLASGFKENNWDWYLERAYHHLLDSEDDILQFAKEIGFNKVFFKSTQTDSLYRVSNNYRRFTVDSPQDFLRFPLLPFPEKLRVGTVLAFLKFSPYFSLYERYTAEKFLQNSMGEKAWNILWQELFRKKFGKYAGNVLASFIWARIKKRAKKLGYIEGGFQTFVNYLEELNKNNNVSIKKEVNVEAVEKRRQHFVINKEQFDAVISTLPTPNLVKITQELFPLFYLRQFKKINYLHAVNLILETDEPILEKTYWLNNCVKDIPIMVLVQHTNFIDKSHYDNHNILYLGWYVGFEDKIWKMEEAKLVDFVVPYLNKILNFKLKILNYRHFRGPFAQPIFAKTFLQNKPDFITPVKNFFIANLDMTYPYDRGTNYAVKLGRQVAGMI